MLQANIRIYKNRDHFDIYKSSFEYRFPLNDGNWKIPIKSKGGLQKV